jgi:hypothetical protein
MKEALFTGAALLVSAGERLDKRIRFLMSRK